MQTTQQSDETQQRPLVYTHRSNCHLVETSKTQAGQNDARPLVYTCTLKFDHQKNRTQDWDARMGRLFSNQAY